MSNHPPIPPNCAVQFSKQFDCVILPCANGILHLRSHYRSDREVIAAVARCAWLDEAEEARSGLKAIANWNRRIRLPGEPRRWNGELQSRLNVANANAEAWRKWVAQ